jgi:plasmid stabilization system protein ParE
MSLPVVLRREARADFDDAFDWYEGQRRGLGVEFEMCVDEAFDRISRTPELFAKVHHDVRRAPVRRFPYSVFYKVESHRVVVISVFHGSRDPKTWQNRV